MHDNNNNNNKRLRHVVSSTRLYNGRDSSTTTVDSSMTAASAAYDVDDAVELRYSEFLPQVQQIGESSRSSSHPPVIFLHGLLGNKRNFASLASSLSTQLSTPRPIYALDLRNHGENVHDWRETMSYSEMARDVLAFMDRTSETNGEKAVLVGHSMGGKVAQALALMHPERIAGLVVLDIAPVRYRSEGKDGSAWKAIEEIVHSVASIDLKEGGYATKRDVDMVLRKGMLEDPALRAFVLTNLEQARSPTAGEENNEEVPSLRWKIHWDGIVNQLERIAGFDVHDEEQQHPRSDDDGDGEEGNMPQYHGDVFFIHGGASRFVRHSHMPAIASYFPNHMLTTIRGAGHWVHAEAPDDTIALLKRYLDR